MNEAYCIDCMEAMAKMPDKCFNLAVVDPPYGVNYKNGGKNKRGHAKAARSAYKDFGGDDMKPPPPEYFSELFRVSENQVIWGANHFTDNLPVSHCWIIWDKEMAMPSYGDGEMAWTSFDGQMVIHRCRWAGMLQENMQHKEARIHPAQKPVALYRWIYQRYTKDGYRVLDTHLGSGSSRIAAYDAGLDFVGFEIDPEYFEKEEERFNAYTAQMNLFLEETT